MYRMSSVQIPLHSRLRALQNAQPHAQLEHTSPEPVNACRYAKAICEVILCVLEKSTRVYPVTEASQDLTAMCAHPHMHAWLSASMFGT